MTQTDENLGTWDIRPYRQARATDQLRETADLIAAVATGTTGPTLRWYGYLDRAVILGVGQSAAGLRDGLADAGTEIVRRSSGGALVLADAQLLALDVVVPATSWAAGTDIVEAYRWLGAVWVRALRRLAPTSRATEITLVSVSEARRDRDAVRALPTTAPGRLREAICFGTLSPYEVGYRTKSDEVSRKLVGLSQIRRRGVVAYQVGVHWQIRGSTLVDTLAVADADRWAASMAVDRAIADLAMIGIGSQARSQLITAVEAEICALTGPGDGALSHDGGDDPRPEE